MVQTPADPSAQPKTGEAETSGPKIVPLRHAVRPAILVLGLVAVAAGAFGLYKIARHDGKQVAYTGACAGSLNLAREADPLVHGEVAALTLATRPNPLDAVAFDDADGHKTTVGAFKGRTILLNLWATWCVPCRQEMPALDKLQGDLGSAAFSVVPINIDTVRLEKPRAFLKEIDARNLPFYADNTADILQQLKRSQPIVGLPTTILVGRDGCEIGTMAGPARWDSPDAKALIGRLANPPVRPASQT